VRGSCPECGLAVRATILSRVDPHADAFKPLPTPRLTANAVMLWPLGGLIAALAAWVPRIADLVAEIVGAPRPAGLARLGWVSVGGLGLSALASIGLIGPTRETPLRLSLRAALGAACYIPLIWCWWRITLVIDPVSPAPYVDADPDPRRLAHRLCLGACAVVILILLRPNARALVARSLVLRTGRVDRQTIYATAAAVALAATGDLVRLASVGLPPRSAVMVADAGSLLVLVASMLVTIGLAGATIDGWRLRRTLLTPPFRLAELLGPRSTKSGPAP